jgi:hypothetical protein
LEDLEDEANLGYIASSRPARATLKDPVLKRKIIKNLVVLYEILYCIR